MSRYFWRSALTSLLLALSLIAGSTSAVLATHTVDPRFRTYYDTHDGMRVLGPPISALEGTVQYFEKGRLEDHTGQGLPAAWEFMYGRLAAELTDAGALIPVAGDSGPTYADLRERADPARRLPPPAYVDGVQPVPSGVFIPFDAVLRPAPGHEVPAFFWEYINQTQLFPGGWLHDIGLPLTAAFEADVLKGSAMRRVILQPFERTVLTYDAVNPAGWQIERANIGTHYLAYRGAGEGPLPPAGRWRGEYFASDDLSGQPVMVRFDQVIDFDWHEEAPGPGLPEDYFSVRWTQQLRVPEEATYHVWAEADDGVRVWVADRLIVDQWRSTKRADGYIRLDPGTYPMRVEYREREGNAHIELDLDDIDDYPQWKGAYYNNFDLDDEPYFVRNDRRIDFDWGDDSPGSGLRRNDFSVRWTREVDLRSGTYRFTITADDGVRLYVDGKRVLDKWKTKGGPYTYTVDVRVRSGDRDIRLDYRDDSGDARVKLTYERLP